MPAVANMGVRYMVVDTNAINFNGPCPSSFSFKQTLQMFAAGPLIRASISSHFFKGLFTAWTLPGY